MNEPYSEMDARGPSDPYQDSNSSSEIQPNRVAPQAVPVRMPTTTPLVTYTLLGLTVLVFLLQLGSEWTAGVDLPANLGMKVNELILRGQIWRLFTPMLLHGGIMHIVFNMYALNAFGPGLERFYGHGRFLALYLLSGFAGNVMSFFFTSASSLGSSTAIFGLLGAEGVFWYLNRDLYGRSAKSAIGNIVTVALINFAIGISTSGIDNWGHLGGLVGGVVFAWLGGPLLKVERGYNEVRLVDQRDDRAALVAGAVVGSIFMFLTVFVFFLRG